MAKIVETDGPSSEASQLAGGEIGYKKPPKKYQFQKGKSGNPKGRPKKLKTLKEAVLQQVHKPINVVANGKHTKITGLDLLASRMVKASFELKPAALSELLSILHSAEVEHAAKLAAAEAAAKQAIEKPPFSWTAEQEKLYAQLKANLSAQKKEGPDEQ